MKISELRRDLYREFADEHGFVHGVPGDFAVINELGACTREEFEKFQLLRCIGRCDIRMYQSFSDLEVPRDEFEKEFTQRDLQRIIQLNEIKMNGDRAIKEQPEWGAALAWLTEKLRKKEQELFHE